MVRAPGTTPATSAPEPVDAGGTPSALRCRCEAKEAAEEVLEGAMPLRMYQLMHVHARLSAADRERLARGLERTLGRGKTEAARADR